MKITNNGTVPCARDVGPAANTFTVTSGGFDVWTSDACSPAGDSQEEEIPAGEAFAVKGTWDGTVTANGCQNATPAEAGASSDSAQPNEAPASAGAQDASPSPLAKTHQAEIEHQRVVALLGQGTGFVLGGAGRKVGLLEQRDRLGRGWFAAVFGLEFLGQHGVFGVDGGPPGGP